MKTKYVNAVKERDIESVRLFLSNEMILDPRGTTFNEMRTYAESKLVDLYEADNCKTYCSDRSVWNEKFLYQVKNDLDLNFSRPRLDFYVEVAQFVLAEKAANLNKEEEEERKRRESFVTSESYEEGERRSGKKKQVFKTIVATGAVVAVVGLCTAKAAVVTVGAVAVATGGYLLHKEKKQ